MSFILMQSGGFNIGGSIGKFFSGIANSATSLIIGTIAFVLVAVVCYYLFKSYQTFAIYKTPCSLTILMENGTEKTRHDLKGAAFWNKNIRDFKIKVPKQRKPHILGYMPDFSLSNSMDGRLFFITSGDRTIWQQYENKWELTKDYVDEKGTVFKYDLISKPVPRETKQLTINSIKNWRDTVDKAKLTAFGIAIGGFIIMVIAHLISLFIQTKIRCGV